jgi:hypothetical protein
LNYTVQPQGNRRQGEIAEYFLVALRALIAGTTLPRRDDRETLFRASFVPDSEQEIPEGETKLSWRFRRPRL